MELRNINTFLKVAATQNFSKAAEQLGYSQSAVTVQIQQLEKELETPLFERIGKAGFSNGKGMEFTSYANEIMGRPTGPVFAKEKGTGRNLTDWRGRIRLYRYLARFPADFSQQLSQSENHHKIRHNRRTDGNGEEQ